MTVNINVGIMGFSDQDMYKFKMIFARSKNDERAYVLTDTYESKPVTLLIINNDDEFISLQKESYLYKHKDIDIPIVNVIKTMGSVRDKYFIRGIIIASRVIPVLDAVMLALKEEALKNKQTEDSYLVLVVDDSKLMQKTIKIELEKTEIPLIIDFADSGNSALEKVINKQYDFIFLDVMMQGMDGFETCTKIRKIEGMAKIPIVMLTSKTSAVDEVRGLVAGCSTYLTKPFRSDEFQEILERIIHWVKKINDGK